MSAVTDQELLLLTYTNKKELLNALIGLDDSFSREILKLWEAKQLKIATVKTTIITEVPTIKDMPEIKLACDTLPKTMMQKSRNIFKK